MDVNTDRMEKTREQKTKKDERREGERKGGEEPKGGKRRKGRTKDRVLMQSILSGQGENQEFAKEIKNVHETRKNSEVSWKLSEETDKICQM